MIFNILFNYRNFDWSNLRFELYDECCFCGYCDFDGGGFYFRKLFLSSTDLRLMMPSSLLYFLPDWTRIPKWRSLRKRRTDAKAFWLLDAWICPTIGSKSERFRKYAIMSYSRLRRPIFDNQLWWFIEVHSFFLFNDIRFQCCFIM